MGRYPASGCLSMCLKNQGRFNESAQLYSQIQAVIAQQAEVRERQQAERLQSRG